MCLIDQLVLKSFSKKKCSFFNANNGHWSSLVEKPYEQMTIEQQQDELLCLLKLANMTKQSVEIQRLFMAARVPRHFKKLWSRVTDLVGFTNSMIKLAKADSASNNREAFEFAGSISENGPFLIRSIKGAHSSCLTSQSNQTLKLFCSPQWNLTAQYVLDDENDEFFSSLLLYSVSMSVSYELENATYLFNRTFKMNGGDESELMITD